MSFRGISNLLFDRWDTIKVKRPLNWETPNVVFFCVLIDTYFDVYIDEVIYVQFPTVMGFFCLWSRQSRYQLLFKGPKYYQMVTLWLIPISFQFFNPISSHPLSIDTYLDAYIDKVIYVQFPTVMGFFCLWSCWSRYQKQSYRDHLKGPTVGCTFWFFKVPSNWHLLWWDHKQKNTITVVNWT